MHDGVWYLGKHDESNTSVTLPNIPDWYTWESVKITIPEDETKVKTPLTRQVGGDHYKTSKVQPIEVIRDWGLGFECGNALKYIARHLKKGEPVKDIEKAIHYLEMYMETLKENLND